VFINLIPSFYCHPLNAADHLVQIPTYLWEAAK